MKIYRWTMWNFSHPTVCKLKYSHFFCIWKPLKRERERNGRGRERENERVRERERERKYLPVWLCKINFHWICWVAFSMCENIFRLFCTHLKMKHFFQLLKCFTFGILIFDKEIRIVELEILIIRRSTENKKAVLCDAKPFNFWIQKCQSKFYETKYANLCVFFSLKTEHGTHQVVITFVFVRKIDFCKL